ncbi:glycosyltransferase [Leisingera sp. D0M16]
MCTRNGAAFLQEQLASFLQQDHSDWSLWVSDDNSTDGTLQILQRFAAAHPEREIRLLHGPEQGAAQNYLSLLCHPDLPGTHIALSDQDDIWLENKLSRALAVMKTADAGGPVLYAGQSVITDAGMRPLSVSSDPQSKPGLRNALVQNLFSGHSSVLNPAALRLVRQSGRPDGIPYHDWWIYLLLSGAGAQCLLDSEPVVAWRQHEGNLIGASRRAGGLRRRVRVMWSGQYRDWMDHLVAHLRKRDALLTKEARNLLAGYAAARAQPGPLRALGYARLGLRRQSGPETALFYALATLGRA